MHDHTYSTLSGSVHTPDENAPVFSSGELPKIFEANKATAEDILQSLHLDNEERDQLERKTRTQSSNPLWFQARQNRITGSKCGRILEQKQKTKALLQFVIYPKPMLHLPKAIHWGKDNEHKACQAYQKYMWNKGHEDLEVTQAGFIVHAMKGWLGASPDAWVVDPSYVP